jgi:hypothetical protein
MTLNLTEREAELLSELLEAHLPDLRREVARTDKHDLRHHLVERQELAEKLVERLAARAA